MSKTHCIESRPPKEGGREEGKAACGPHLLSFDIFLGKALRSVNTSYGTVLLYDGHFQSKDNCLRDLALRSLSETNGRVKITFHLLSSSTPRSNAIERSTHDSFLQDTNATLVKHFLKRQQLVWPLRAFIEMAINESLADINLLYQGP